MRVLMFLTAILFFSSSMAFAQLEVEIVSAEFTSESTLSVLAHIRNLGSSGGVFIPHGRAAMHINPNLRDDIDILLRYRPKGVDRIVKDLPSSITIKTWFGGSIEAEMFQEIASTGTTNYQLWEIVFSVPYNALDISVDIFGAVHRIPDKKEAIRAEREATEKANIILSEADKLVTEGNYKEALNKYGLALGIEFRSRSRFGENYSEALSAVGDEEMNASNYDEAAKYLLKAYRHANEYNLSNKSRIAKELAIAYVKLGKVDQETGNFSDALWFFKVAKKLDTNNLEAQ